MLEVGTG